MDTMFLWIPIELKYGLAQRHGNERACDENNSYEQHVI